MPLASLCLLALVQNPVALSRKFVPTEKLAYQINSHITAEQRQKGIQTFIPEDLDINYGFDFVVKAMKNDGVAVVTYRRPAMTEIRGETATSAPKPTVEKSDKVYELTVSPVNELIDTRDVTPKKPVKKPAKKKPLSARWTMPAAPLQAPIFGQYISEMHRLALFIGGIDSGLDFAPKLPLEPVKVGDTWKRTVGYQPQKLSGKDGKSAVQRLDYLYTYVGPMKVDGKAILRVQAKLELKTDLADYLRTLLGEEADKTNLKTMPLHLQATIDFDLDPKTRHTLAANATSEGGFELYVKEDPEAYYEERFKGRTSLELVGRKLGVAAK